MAALQGFIPSRQPVADWVRRYNAQANSDGANQTIAKGDAVAFVNGVIVPASAGMDPAHPGYGVVLAVYTTAGRPLTFQNTKILVSGQPGQVDVCFDPNQTYYVRCDASAGLTDTIGENVMLVVSAANSLTGISGHSVTTQTSASINNLFKVINYGPFDQLSGINAGAGANQGVEVKWNRHLLKAATA